MSASVAALSLFRDCIKRGDSITAEDDAIRLSGESLARKSATNFISLRGRGSAYTVETIYYQWKCRDMAYGDYVKECETANVERVNPLDKRDLLAYLSGEVSELAGLKSIVASADSAERTTAPPLKKQKITSDDGDGGVKHAAQLGNAGMGADDDATFTASINNSNNINNDPDSHAAMANGKENYNMSQIKSKKQPREQRCIDAVLMAPDWDFSTIREKLGKSLIKAKNSKGSRLDTSNNTNNNNNTTNGEKPAFDPRGDRYSNNQDRFWRENMGKEFHDLGINPTGSFAQMAKKANAANAAAGVAAGTKNNSNNPKDKTVPPPSSSSGRRPSSAAGRSSSGTKRMDPKAQDLSQLRPILIIPGPGSGIMNVTNVKEFFEGGHFESEDSLRTRGIAPDFSGRIKAHRTPGGNCSKAEYLLVSNVGRLTDDEWSRVVGVICTGKAWQFKHWKYAKSSNGNGNSSSNIDVVNCLHHVQGFFFHYDDVAPDAKAASWAVKLIPISRTKRHNDTYAQTQFFDTVDNFIKTHSIRVRY